ncbi:hypothetical protein AX14_002090 [Amanita brunnescens Koide BX004]|nr:hypothetical protein AX14_002090 [Amanita brunnescens Koide BX004]
MGVRGLWKKLGPAGQERSLLQLSLDDDFKYELGSLVLKVGVDASIWVEQSQHIFNTPGHVSAGQNPELCILFYKLAWLLDTCILPIFVFDGPLHPPEKRGQSVIVVENWVTGEFKKLIEAFGFCWHQAPAEAEAELAFLNSTGAIDLILMEDSDALTFGAFDVIRASMPTTPKCDNVMLFSMESIESNPDVSLTHDDLVLMAVLIGGDYDQNGLCGCGEDTAYKLARWTYLGQHLVDAFKTSKEAELDSRLRTWRQELRQALVEDTWIFGGCTHPRIASAVTKDFPPMRTVQQYVNPPAFLAEMTKLCKRLFLWGSTNIELQDKLYRRVWPGVCLRTLLLEPEQLLDGMGLLPTVSRIMSSTIRCTGNAAGLWMYHIEVSTSPLTTIVDSNMRGLRQEDLQSSKLPKKVTVSVPASVLDRQLPGLSRDFNLTKSGQLRQRAKAEAAASCEQQLIDPHPYQ